MNHVDMKRTGRLQHGIAAIEFALVLTMLLLFLYGIATFGSVLYTQQAVSRAAEDGARALTAFNGPFTPSMIPEVQSQVQGVVYDSLSTSLVGPPGALSSQAQRKAWLQGRLAVVIDPSTGVVRVTYPYSQSRILDLSEAWVPTDIVGSARIAL